MDNVRKAMSEKDASILVVNALDEIACKYLMRCWGKCNHVNSV